MLMIGKKSDMKLITQTAIISFVFCAVILWFLSD
jgi:hypothetical protein